MIQPPSRSQIYLAAGITDRIFHGKAYYEAFLETLEESHDRFDARFHAYCLMGNHYHYHLLIETSLAKLDRIMRHMRITEQRDRA